MDADESYPQRLMSGDDNLAVDGTPVSSGVVEIPSSASASWAGTRHGKMGNIGYADGSVEETSTAGLQKAFRLAVEGTGFDTNRVAIP